MSRNQNTAGVNNDLYELRDRINDKVDAIEQYRLGRILTIVDASIADKEQRKALKDLVKQAFHDPEFYTLDILRSLWNFAEKHAKDQAVEPDYFCSMGVGETSAK